MLGRTYLSTQGAPYTARMTTNTLHTHSLSHACVWGYSLTTTASCAFLATAALPLIPSPAFDHLWHRLHP